MSRPSPPAPSPAQLPRLALSLLLTLAATNTSASAQQQDIPKPLFFSDRVDRDTPGHSIAIDVAIPDGAEKLYLVVTDAGDGFSCDWADWAEPRLVLGDGSEQKLTGLAWSRATSDWGQVRRGANAGGGALSVLGSPISDGIGVHANALVEFDLPENTRRFKARGALDTGGTSQGGGCTVRFAVFDRDPTRWLASQSRASRRAGGGGPVDPAGAVAALDVHPELEATLFAHEPDLLSPSAIDVDHRGRVWVCEVVNYRRHNGKRPEGDRIVVFEDTDGDRTADRHHVFHQGTDIDSAHGICVLGDRVIVSAGESVFSLFDDDGDGRSDRKEMMFTGTGGAQHDHGIHAFHAGPDGKLYFNFGNAAKRLCDADGNPVTDLAGNPVTADRNPYQEGMVFRCNQDGSDVETVGWNFRNNWEIAVDSFGALWQSDNDDDGNRGVRINYVIPYGNYGYRDEITGAGWRDPRPGMEAEIPLQHWHLNDPGVVPNLLQTGQGSPTGILVYEGDLLPDVFHGQVIHSDAGPNVVRAYPAEPDGAGYSARIVDILTGARDRWFRPSDVCTAPDGSLVVADWYDPGVGGHGMGDLERGRLFLLAPPDHRYSAPAVDPDTLPGALAALGSPNEDARFLGREALASGEFGDAGKLALRALFDNRSAPAHLRARTLFLLDDPTPALGDPEPRVRMAGLRAIELRRDPTALRKAVQTVSGDPDPRVRALAAALLRFDGSPDADQLWAQLATRHTSGDRWSLEALGIGADLHWTNRFAAYLAATGEEPHPDIVWRSRCPEESPGRIADLATTTGDLRYVRAFHFLPASDAKSAAVRRVLAEAPAPAATATALFELRGDGDDLDRTRLAELARGTDTPRDRVALVTRFGLDGFDHDLLDLARRNPSSQLAADAVRFLLGGAGAAPLEAALAPDADGAGALLHALGATGDRRAIDRLVSILTSSEDDARTRTAADALCASNPGEKALVELASAGRLPKAAEFTVAAKLGRSRDASVRDAIAQALDLPPAPGADSFPPVHELVRLRGDTTRGKAAFEKATCATCHVVGGQGINFGPDLSQIGSKLPPEALYESILYPSNGVAHGYTGVTATTTSGESLVGLVDSDTPDHLTLRLPGGLTRTLPTSDIGSRTDLDQSLMPPGLAALLTTQEFADLVAYLTSLR